MQVREKMKPSVKQNQRLRCERGQTLVEFALIVPLLLLLLFGVIEFGRVFHAQLVITNAAREGARKAVVTSGTDADVSNVVKDSIANMVASLHPDQVQEKNVNDITNGAPEGNAIWYAIEYASGRNVGEPVKVYVKGRVEIIVPLISSIIDDPKPMATAVMRIEQK